MDLLHDRPFCPIEQTYPTGQKISHEAQLPTNHHPEQSVRNNYNPRRLRTRRTPVFLTLFRILLQTLRLLFDAEDEVLPLAKTFLQRHRPH